MLLGQLVQVEQALVDALLQVQGFRHVLETTLPILGLRLSHVQEGEANPTPVLQQHQPLGHLTMLLGEEQEDAGEVLQGHAVVVQGAGPGQALEGDMELQGGVAVALMVVALACLRGNYMDDMAGGGKTIWKASWMREVRQGQQQVRRCWLPPQSLLMVTHDGRQRRALGHRAGGLVRALG